MKYFDELMELETALIDIETHIALLDGFVQGVESVDQITMINGLHGIASILKTDNKLLSDLFIQLFNAIKEEANAEHIKPKKSGRKK